MIPASVASVTRVAVRGRVVLRRCTALSSTERHRPPRATRRCSVETHDFIGEFILEQIEFTRERLLISLDRPGDKQIVVTFGLGHSEFETASQVLKIINGEINPFD